MYKFPKSAILAACVVTLAACTSVGERTLVSVGYYSVGGETFDELDRDIELHGPNVLGVGKALASTDLRMIPRFSYSRESGGCRVSSARVNVNAKVTLPRHTNERALKADLASAWSNLEEYARIHEAVHLAIADRYALRMERTALALQPQDTCADMREATSAMFSALFQEHHDEQLAFDASERLRIRRLLAENQ